MAPIHAIIVAVGVLAYRTGGQESPFLGLLFVPLVLAGALTMRHALYAAAAAAIAYTAVAVARPAPHPWLGALQVALFFVVAALTADGIRRHERNRRRQETDAEEARQALDIQKMLGSAEDLDVTLDLVSLKQREVVAADSYAVLLADGSALRARVVSGLPAGVMSLRFEHDGEDSGWRPSDAHPLYIADTTAAPSRFSAMDPSASSILLVPLQSVENLVGLLFFGSRELDAFDADATRRAEAFGNHVVFPIERAQLDEELRRLAYTDVQTSLPNHRHFQAQMAEELFRAQRYGRPVSLILLDIDNFKSFNDRYGHPAGDRLLRAMSDLLKESLRAVDIPARYGGEEFAVICPETQREQAVLLAERLRTTIAEADFTGDGTDPGHITVSVGVAAFPLDAETQSTLVDAADKALYKAKRAGKNRVATLMDE